jgi:tetratricopeptide (TPR) repeat protein/tRNA A-37 threonylcarbamoyl transferase component Bud32
MASLTSRLAEALAGRYDIERPIGEGGMATVYLATDTRHGRRVAIKVLRPELSTAIGAARFLAEIRTTANLLHPHILPLHDSGEVDGTVYYVMPFVEGPTLRDRIARAGHLPVDEAVRIAVEVADALQHAHANGVVHRDIKPANILLQGEHAVVADFGIALAHRTHDDLRMTETGMSLGTPTYMSPEQAAGERHLDARTDVYALGCVLYEMLAGVPPFEAPTAQGLLAKVMTETPRPLVERRADVPPHVDAAIRSALAKRPEDRQSTARAFADALRPPVASRVITTATDASATGSGATRRRGPLIAGVGGIAAIVAIAAGAWLSTRTRDASIPASIAAVAGTRAAAPLTVLLGAIENRTGDDTYDALLPELLATSLEQSRTVGREIAEREGLSAVIRQSLTRLGDSYVLVATAERPDGQQVATVRETFAAPEELPARVDAIGTALRRAFGESAESLAAASVPLAQVTSKSLEAVRAYSMGRTRMYAGDPRGAITLLSRAIELDPDFAMARGALGAAYTNVQDMERAGQELTIAAALASRAPEAEREKILGDFGMTRRDFDGACPHFEVLASIRPRDPAAHLSLGYCTLGRLDFAGAVAATERAVALQPSVRTQLNLALVRFLAGDLDGAKREADAVREQAPGLMQVWYVQGLILMARGAFAEARAHYEAMVAQGGDFEMEGRSGLADVARATGRPDEARTQLEAARAVAEARGNRSIAASATLRLAELAIARSDRADAMRWLDGSPASGDPWLLYQAGRAWARLGDAADAQRAIARIDSLMPATSRQRASLGALVRAELALATGKTAEAVAQAEAALRSEASTVAHETAARAYLAAARPDAAARELAQVVARPQERCRSLDAPACYAVVDAAFELGRLRDDAGDRAGADSLLRRVVSAWDGAPASARLAEARRRLGRAP